MKYKIGNTEVEAIQWNGDNAIEMRRFLPNKACEVENDYFLDGINFGTVNFNHNLCRIKLLPKEYLVKSKESIFPLSEQDFNNMATKVKEPKFKVGDKAYLLGLNSIWLDKVTSITVGGWYTLDSDEECRYEESELFTLEEIIEKLKEL